ncbi:ribosome small subunit-dependent GTPase A, partial [Limosilactobacillus reuteri]
FYSYDTVDITLYDMPHLFPEIAKIASDFKLRGCLHIKEPQCAVKEAVNNGIIMKSLYDDYLQFHELIANQIPNYKKRGNQDD